MCSSIRKYKIRASMSTNDVFVDEISSLLSSCIWYCFSFRVFGHIIHSNDYIFISLGGRRERPNKINSNFVKGCFYFDRMERAMLSIFSSLLTTVTSLYIISNMFIHLRPIVSTFDFVKHFVNSKMCSKGMVVHEVQYSFNLMFLNYF